MIKRSKKPEEFEVVDLGLNPLLIGLCIKVGSKIRKRNKDEPDVDIKIEASPYLKLFEIAGAKAKMNDLSPRGKELLLHVMYSLRSGEDFMWLNRSEYMKSMGMSSVNTFKDAVKDLSASGYIMPHERLKDVIWINPQYFFKGNRINKYPNNLK